jgi:hypothetical protein
VLLQHFRGNLDNWNPALIDALASAAEFATDVDEFLIGAT